MTTPAAPAPGPVVIGYDGRDAGADALALGLRWARLTGAQPIVAVAYPEPAPIGWGRVDAEWVADRRAEAERAVATGRGLAPGVPDFRTIASSSAAHGLDDLVGHVRGSAIVVGSSRHGGAPGRVHAGSTASRLLHGARVPVAVAPQGYASRDAADVPVVAAAYVHTSEARAALHVAASVAAAARAPLRVVTAIAGEAPTLPWLIGVDAEHAFSETARDAFQAAVDSAVAGLAADVAATAELLVGDVVDTLADVDAGLLFCGSRGYGPVRSVLLGGVSAKLARRARSPLVVVPRTAG